MLGDEMSAFHVEDYVPGRVTIIVPMFNAKGFVDQAIASCLRQTYEDIEVLVVDDGSTDDGLEAVQAFSDFRIHVIRHDSNQGVGPARNSGLLRARGEWITVLDADDCYLPRRIELLLHVATAKGQAHVYTDDWLDWQLATAPPMSENLPTSGLNVVRKWRFEEWLTDSREARPFFHRKLLAGMAEWYSSDPIGEDVVFVSRLVTHNNSSILQIPIKTYVYRNTSGSLTTPSLRTAEARVRAYSRILEAMPTQYRNAALTQLEAARAEVLTKQIRVAIREGRLVSAARVALRNPKVTRGIALRVYPYVRMRMAKAMLRRRQLRSAVGPFDP